VPDSKSLSIFYSYPPETIALWSGVSVLTAKQWESGARKPSRQSLRLFVLNRDGRVLNDQWRLRKVVHGAIIDHTSNRTTAAQLEGYALILPWVAAVAARDPDTQRQYYELLKRA
jgi:hypothetical protein